MKINYTFLYFLLFSTTLFAQEWVKKMEDPNANFFEIQQSFNKHWKKQERKEKLKSFFMFDRKDEIETLTETRSKFFNEIFQRNRFAKRLDEIRLNR